MGREWDDAPALRRHAHVVLSALVRCVWGIEVEGLENVPEQGPILIAGNHVALADGPLLALTVAPRRYMMGLGKVELFSVPLLGWFLRSTGAIPLDRRGDVSAMRAALEVLGRGGCLGILPEGTRSKDGRPGLPRPGVGFLASRSGALVVPARLVNTDRFPWARPLRVRFGAPMRFEGPDDSRAACAAFARRVMDRVFSL